VRQYHRAADHLIRVLGIDAETERKIDRLVELRRRHALHDRDRLLEGVLLVRGDLRRGRLVALAPSLTHDRRHVVSST